MTITSTQRLYQVAGHTLSADDGGSCWLCGGANYGAVPVKSWVKATFTNYDDARGNWDDGVCEACVWATRYHSDELAEKTGKEKPQNMPTYSHFIVDGEWHVNCKAHTQQIAQALLDIRGVPEMAVIANSGQKHLVHLASINTPGQTSGVVQFERELIMMEQSALRGLLDSIETLYNDGHSKSAIRTGLYTFRRDTDIALWRSEEACIRGQRGSPLFTLAVWLAQKEEEK